MANTVIAVRSSGTAAATPSLGVIANGEIALNFADGIIYYKTSSNTLGSIRTTQPAGLTTEIQYNDAGSFGANANFTFNKTIATLNVKNINVSTNLVAVEIAAATGGYFQFPDGTKQFTANAGGGGSVSASSITGVMNLTQGGANNTTYTTGAILTSNGTAFVSLSNTGTAGTYANASHVPVITTDAYGRVSAVTNTAIALSAAAITSGTLAVGRGGTGVTSSTGTGSVVRNTSPALTTPNIGVPSFATLTNATGLPIVAGTTGTLTIARGGSNNTTYTTGAFLTSNGTAFVSVANTGTAGTYANATHVPVITTDAYGRVTAVTNTAISFPAEADTLQTVTTRGSTTANAINVTNTTASTSNTTGALIVAGGIGVKGNVYADAVYDGGIEVIAFANQAFTQANSANVLAQQAFDKGNSANVLAQSAYNAANSANTFDYTTISTTAGVYGNATFVPVITLAANGRVSSITNTAITGFANATFATASFDQANGAFTQANSANVLAQQAFDKANTDATNITATAGVYGNATIVPVITLAANGRVSLITNTAIAIDTAAITSGTLAVARGGTGNTSLAVGSILIGSGTNAITTLANTGTAGTYGNSTHIPVVTTDAYGRVSAVTNTVIQSSTTSVQGIVQLNDTVTSTSTSVAATANAVNAVYNFASTKFNSSGGTISGDTTITGNLVVNGTTTTVNTSTVSTNDSLIKLAANNVVGDVLDIGFYGQSNTSNTIVYHGLIRQASNNFILFKNFSQDPSGNVINTAFVTIANTATLRANITGGTVSSLASAIGVADGGTGATTLTAGGILIGSGTSAVTTLANTGTAGTYANAAYVPVITTDAYGRVSSITNTAIAIDTAAITSGTLADARLPATGTAGTYANASHIPVITTDSKGRVTAVTNTLVQIAASQVTSGVLPFAQGGANNTTYTTGAILTSNGTAFVALANTGTAGTYANASHVPVITTDAYGRVSAVTNTAIQSGTTSVAGIVQLTDSISSTSTTTAATPNSVKTAYDYAQGAFTKANQTAQLAFTTVSANGTNLVADANNDTLTITAASANGIFINSDAGTDALDIGLRNSGVTSGTYGNTTTAVTITVDAFGRITSISNAAISAGASIGDVLALAIALG